MSSHILAISGNDILSGGGLHADLTTFAANKLHGFLVVSCLTALTSNGFEVIPIDDTVVKQQLDSLVDVDFAAIKLGLLPNVEVAEQALHFVQNHKDTPVVLDPVLVCKEKHDLEVSSLRDELVKFFPYVTIITPNLVEAQLLAQMEIKTLDDMKAAAKKLHELGARYVVIKGGSRFDDKEAIDLFYDGKDFTFLRAPILGGNNIGAGCTFASSIASKIAKSEPVEEAVRQSKDFVRDAISHADDYGVNQLF